MKMKLNLNVDGAKRALIQHGEKVAFGATALVLLLFIYKTVQMERLGPEHQPDKLKIAADDAERNLQQSKWDPEQKVEVVDYPVRARSEKLNIEHYQLVTHINKPLFAAKQKRPEPKALPVEELLAAGGIGAFALEDKVAEGDEDEEAPALGGNRFRGVPAARPLAGADEEENTRPIQSHVGVSTSPRGVSPSNNMKGFSWVAVRGLVPLKKQFAEFEQSFQNAAHTDPTIDVPAYADFVVERVEVTNSKTDSLSKLKWQEVDLEKNGKIMQDFAASTVPEVVDPECVDYEVLTLPLGPMAFSDWNPASAGHPKLPMTQVNTGGVGARPAVHAGGGMLPPRSMEMRGGMRGGMPPRGMQPLGGMRGAAPALRQGGRHLGNQLGVEEKKEAKWRRGANAGNQAVMPETADAELPKFKLFRFIDYTVAPGKRYRYRVKLVLYNPNYELEVKYLQDPAFAKNEHIESAWSQPTAVVHVPGDTNVLAGPVVKSSKSDPQMKLMITKLNLNDGSVPATEETVSRGSIANFVKEKGFEVPDAQRTVLTKSPQDVKFVSNALVVDIDGGKSLVTVRKGDQGLTEPAKVLVLQNGLLSVRDELADAEEFQSYQYAEEGEQPTMGRGFERGPRDMGPRGRTPPRTGRDTEMMPPPGSGRGRTAVPPPTGRSGVRGTDPSGSSRQPRQRLKN